MKNSHNKDLREKNILPIIIGISSDQLTSLELELLKNHPVYGFILFSRNIKNKNQVKELTASLKNLYPERAVEGSSQVKIFVDQEGGRVARIKPPIAKKEYPTAEHFYNIYQSSESYAKINAMKLCEENYYEIMQEAKDLGFDSLCAPVCDLRFKGASPVIGNRSFGSTPIQVYDLATSAIDGILKAGGIPIIKHIPGHGRAIVDSHYQLPYVNEPLQELVKTDFIPFNKIFWRYQNEVWAMTAHIVYNSIDDEKPLTLSKKGLNYVRKNIFDGIIVSDDIGMLALHGKIGEQKILYNHLIREFSGLNLDEINEIRPELVDILNKIFENNTDSQFNSGIFNSDIESVKNTLNADSDTNTDICSKIEQGLNVQFLASLSKVTKEALEAGCDYILHCSGNIEEMGAVIEATEDFLQIN